jgi:hypothetical protein
MLSTAARLGSKASESSIGHPNRVSQTEQNEHNGLAQPFCMSVFTISNDMSHGAMLLDDLVQSQLLFPAFSQDMWMTARLSLK